MKYCIIGIGNHAKTKIYPSLIKNLEKNSGVTEISFRKKMAGKIFKEISKYDNVISKWFNV